MYQNMTPDLMRADIAKLNKRIEKLRETITETERSRDAIEHTLNYYMAPPVKPLSTTHKDVDPDSLREMRLRDAVRYLAERNNGEFHSTTGRELIVAAGIIKDTHSRQAIYQLVSEWSLFEKVRRGVYKIVTAEPIRAVQ